MNHKFQASRTAPLPHAVSVHQAIEQSPSLGRLTELVRESGARLEAIKSLIPETLWPFVAAGPIDGEDWCLLVTGNATAAKMRQLLPLFKARLAGKGWKVTSIRLKILLPKK